MTARLLIEYDGSNFSGWATQPGKRTVQDELERALTTVRRQPTKLIVAGRTDAGVHALGQVASHEGEPAAVHALNGLLPPDIAVIESAQASNGFDARADATARTYRYRLNCALTRPAVDRDYVAWHRRPLDRDLLNRSSALIVGEHDFTAFTLAKGSYRSYIRTVSQAEWIETDPNSLEFWITADSFLRRMVRTLVATQLEIADGRRSIESLPQLLSGAPRSDSGNVAPPQALYLASVAYK